MVNVDVVTLSRTDHPVCAFIRRLRSIFLMAQPPLLSEEGNTLPCNSFHSFYGPVFPEINEIPIQSVIITVQSDTIAGKNCEVKNENTAQAEKCIGDLAIDSRCGADLHACLRAVGESPHGRNSARARWQGEPFGAGAAIARWPSGPVRNLGIRQRQIHTGHCGGSQTRRRAVSALG